MWWHLAKSSCVGVCERAGVQCRSAGVGPMFPEWVAAECVAQHLPGSTAAPQATADGWCGLSGSETRVS